MLFHVYQWSWDKLYYIDCSQCISFDPLRFSARKVCPYIPIPYPKGSNSNILSPLIQSRKTSFPKALRLNICKPTACSWSGNLRILGIPTITTPSMPRRKWLWQKLSTWLPERLSGQMAKSPSSSQAKERPGQILQRQTR